MTARVKICGINSEIAFDAAAEAGADWVGFVFFPPSPRAVTPPRAAQLSARWLGGDDGPARVGLFVEPTDEAVAAALAALPLDALQLYAGADRAASLREKFGIPVWRAVGVATADDLPASAESADRLVIEAKPPREASRPGGNARRFDWSLLREWQPATSWVLAGGLTVDNVRDALRATGAPAVDVSSGVESAPGIKDPALIRRFVAAVRG